MLVFGDRLQITSTSCIDRREALQFAAPASAVRPTRAPPLQRRSFLARELGQALLVLLALARLHHLRAAANVSAGSGALRDDGLACIATQRGAARCVQPHRGLHRLFAPSFLRHLLSAVVLNVLCSNDASGAEALRTSHRANASVCVCARSGEERVARGTCLLLVVVGSDLHQPLRPDLAVQTKHVQRRQSAQCRQHVQ